MKHRKNAKCSELQENRKKKEKINRKKLYRFHLNNNFQKRKQIFFYICIEKHK